jgi:hypothetical protein
LSLLLWIHFVVAGLGSFGCQLKNHGRVSSLLGHGDILTVTFIRRFVVKKHPPFCLLSCNGQYARWCSFADVGLTVVVRHL